MSALSISKILMPVDFSERSEEAVRYGARLAKHFKAGITVLHVIEEPHIDYAMIELPDAVERLSKLLHDRAETRLQHFATADLEAITVERKIAMGRPADEILVHAAAADMVIMPTQGHGRIREFLIGSVTAKVLHDCERPVLTGIHLVENRTLPDWQVKNILCAIDFGPETEDVLLWGKRLMDEFGASVTVIHADSDIRSVERLEQAVATSGLKAETIVEAGEPHDVIVSAAQRLGSDLVIIGRGSNTGALGRLRAQAYEIVRKSPCPVFSV